MAVHGRNKGRRRRSPAGNAPNPSKFAQEARFSCRTIRVSRKRSDSQRSISIKPKIAAMNFSLKMGPAPRLPEHPLSRRSDPDFPGARLHPR